MKKKETSILVKNDQNQKIFRTTVYFFLFASNKSQKSPLLVPTLHFYYLPRIFSTYLAF